MKRYLFLSAIPVLFAITIGLSAYAGDKVSSGLYGHGTLQMEDVPLMQAIEKGDLSLVKKLINKGASLNAELFNGMKPIHEAAASGHADIAQYLLSKGADVDSKMINGITPLFIAIESQHPEVAKVLLSKGAQYSGHEISLAINRNELDMVKLLVTTPRFANLAGSKGLTLLHAASFLGRPRIVQYLIDQGAEVDVKTEDGDTPLDLATKSKDKLSSFLASGVSKEQLLQQGINYDGLEAVITLLKKYERKE